ncbi:MAG: hypothetical protein V3T05_02925 [Myxococcota bacterium]
MPLPTLTAVVSLYAGILPGAEVEPSVGPTPPISINRVWQLLPDPAEKGPRHSLSVAADKIGDWTLTMGDVDFDGLTLAHVVALSEEEPLLRALREQLRQPIDLIDFLYFLDDVLVAGESGLRNKTVCVPPGRARSAGILLHPHDVFWNDRARLYADGYDELHIDRPPRPTRLEPAKDGDRLGPNWTARYVNPHQQPEMVAALEELAPSRTFVPRLTSLKKQLRDSGADVWITSTVRFRHRGYLMWGAFYLSRARSQQQLRRRLARVNRRNSEWGLNIPIVWNHPDGWRATVEAARAMTDAYDVVYATEKGAKDSKHYDGLAFDIVARALPRNLRLVAPDGTVEVFDLSDPEQSRDLSLTIEIIEWVQEHFELRKLKGDYPHWQDHSDVGNVNRVVAER